MFCFRRASEDIMPLQIVMLMAQHRIFSLKVIDTDMFLDMSPTAQLLY